MYMRHREPWKLMRTASSSGGWVKPLQPGGWAVSLLEPPAAAAPSARELAARGMAAPGPAGIAVVLGTMRSSRRAHGWALRAPTALRATSRLLTP
eukprot:1329628-Prymnesium_polylepis.2